MIVSIVKKITGFFLSSPNTKFGDISNSVSGNGNATVNSFNQYIVNEEFLQHSLACGYQFRTEEHYINTNNSLIIRERIDSFRKDNLFFEKIILEFIENPQEIGILKILSAKNPNECKHWILGLLEKSKAFLISELALVHKILNGNDYGFVILYYGEVSPILPSDLNELVNHKQIKVILLLNQDIEFGSIPHKQIVLSKTLEILNLNEIGLE